MPSRSPLLIYLRHNATPSALLCLTIIVQARIHQLLSDIFLHEPARLVPLETETIFTTTGKCSPGRGTWQQHDRHRFPEISGGKTRRASPPFRGLALRWPDSSQERRKKKLRLPGLAALPLREADPGQTRTKQHERGWLRNRSVGYIPAKNP